MDFVVDDTYAPGCFLKPVSTTDKEQAAVRMLEKSITLILMGQIETRACCGT